MMLNVITLTLCSIFLVIVWKFQVQSPVTQKVEEDASLPLNSKPKALR